MAQASLMIVDDEPDVLDSLAEIFQSRGYRVTKARTGRDAVSLYSEDPAPIVLCDYSLPDAEGTELIGEFRSVNPDVQMVIITGKGTIDIAVSAMKAGVLDFITKPLDPEHLLRIVTRAQQFADVLAERRTLKEDLSRLVESEAVGSSPAFRKALKLAQTVSPTDSTVLIEGESGTGKEVIARLIHRNSKRSAGPFVAVDCGAIPEGLMESELFGHEKGAFTGALHMKPGRFERAHNGTLFLDEITNLPLSSQAKLLRALQEMVIERVGGTRAIPVDFRLIAASNVSLQDAVMKKRFREDLYYRLNIVKVKLPPLRERKSDILALAQRFMSKHSKATGKEMKGISRDALMVLMEHSWPGNVRELENAIEHALIMSRHEEILPGDLPDLTESSPRRETLDTAEIRILTDALRGAQGNKQKAARMLGIPRSSLYSKLRKYGLEGNIH